ncbi:hypothetical protein EV363DRAFT_1427031 [Boletus edulis]|nr:hypothetical protein EV363DRAFT_1427031 [Boletus edulis]
MLQSARKVYAHHIMNRVPDRGYPLYSPGPNPNLPDHYQRGGIYVGDVGFISDTGGFEFLFNQCLPCDHPFNHINGVPDGFNDIPLMVLEEQGYKDVFVDMGADSKGQVMFTCDTTKFEPAQAGAVLGGEWCWFGVQFSTSELEGGILVLPHGSWSFNLLNGLGRLYWEMVKNWQSWYHFAKSKHTWMTSKPLLLVTGFHKASDWQLSSYSHDDAGSVAISFVLPL